MGLPACRVGDEISHGGAVIGGSLNVLTNGLPAARLGDPVFCDIHSDEGDIQTIVTASLTVRANGLGRARIGDLISCGATLITGSPNVLVGP